MKKRFLLLVSLLMIIGIVYTETKFNAAYSETTFQAQFDKYSTRVKEIIYDEFPASYSYLTKETLFKITVQRDGTIKNMEILQSSGSQRYDKKIIKAVNETKLPEFPEEIKAEELNFSFDITKNKRFLPVIIPIWW